MYFFVFVAITCGHPGNPSFGVTQGTQFNLNDVVRFVCNTGFVLQGSLMSHCQSNGQWSNTLPKCKSTLVCVCSKRSHADLSFIFKLDLHYLCGTCVSISILEKAQVCLCVCVCVCSCVSVSVCVVEHVCIPFLFF